MVQDSLLRRQAERLAPLPPGPANDRSLGSPQLVRLENWHTSIPRLNSLVASSFLALRERLYDEVGYDFLAEVSEALRPVDFVPRMAATISRGTRPGVPWTFCSTRALTTTDSRAWRLCVRTGLMMSSGAFGFAVPPKMVPVANPSPNPRGI
ncbi:MAG: hypothetical protein Q9O62_07520 [Ardenticatenia bacterium]|nr:hypothetical protein [Ardenticatenia bacterium]